VESTDSIICVRIQIAIRANPNVEFTYMQVHYNTQNYGQVQ
jgi:hypothetical protein